METVEQVTASLAAARDDGSLTLPDGSLDSDVGSFENQIEANRWLL